MGRADRPRNRRNTRKGFKIEKARVILQSYLESEGGLKGPPIANLRYDSHAPPSLTHYSRGEIHLADFSA